MQNSSWFSYFKQEAYFHRLCGCEWCCMHRCFSVTLHWSTFHLKVALNTISTSHSLEGLLTWTLLTSLLPCLQPTPVHLAQTSWTCDCGALSLAPIPARHSASILPAINLMFPHHQGLRVLIMTDTLQWKRLPELLLLLVEDLADFPASTWRVCRKEQRGGWHQGWPAIF